MSDPSCTSEDVRSRLAVADYATSLAIANVGVVKQATEALQDCLGEGLAGSDYQRGLLTARGAALWDAADDLERAVGRVRAVMSLIIGDFDAVDEEQI